jgi:hypothetical protein
MSVVGPVECKIIHEVRMRGRARRVVVHVVYSAHGLPRAQAFCALATRVNTMNAELKAAV